MTIDKETRSLIKNSIKPLVEEKVNLTRERHEYKLKTRGNVAENERLSFFESIDDTRSGLKHDIRHGLLLYGYIRGRDYKQLESKVRKGNEPSASDICLFGGSHSDLGILQTEIEGWLEGKASPHQWKRPQDTEEAA